MKTAESGAPVILTPEHVPIRLFPAGLGARFMAVLLDGIITLALSALASTVLNALIPFGLGGGLTVAVVFVIQWGYHLYFEVRGRGQSPGKKACGLRVVDRRGLPITFQQSFVRNIVRVLDFAPVFYGVGALACLLDRHGRRLGDLAADTLVVQEFRAEDHSRALEGSRRFNSLQVPRVTRRIRQQVGLEDRELILSIFLRAERMDAKARFDLMEEVGNHYRKTLDVDDPHLSGENLLRGLLAILYTDRG
jgi:uncharacterized RDD family membrane protein YckC